MSTDAPAPPPIPHGPVYPLDSAIARNTVLVFACGAAIDRAMRQLHDVPADLPALADFDDAVAAQIVDAYRAEAAHRFHERYRTDQRRCRWCRVAANEARAELEADE